MRTYLPILAAALLAAPAANAATSYTLQSDFDAAIGGVSTVSGGFSGQPDGPIASPSTFDNGITIELNGPSSDNFVVDGDVLRLSVDNTSNPNPITSSIELFFPSAVTAFAFEFGMEQVTAPDGGIGSGLGNNSGTTLTAGDFTFNFSTLNSANPGFTGFFGVVADAGDTFSSVLFTSNGLGSFGDDDFTVTNIEYAPIPLPAGLPLLAAGLGVFGLLKRRKG